MNTPSPVPDLRGPDPRAPVVTPATTDIERSAERWTRLPREGERVVLLLHGLGSSEDDLISLAPFLPQGLVYVSLRGIHRYGPGWAWLDHPVDAAGRTLVTASAEALERWIGDLEHGTVVGAVGFSQGAMLALELLRRRPGSLDWVAQLSGGPFPARLPGDEELARRRPPVLWGHGGRDPLFDAERETQVRQWLRTHADVTELCSPMLGHGVDEQVLGALAGFIAEQESAQSGPIS